MNALDRHQSLADPGAAARRIALILDSAAKRSAKAQPRSSRSSDRPSRSCWRSLLSRRRSARPASARRTTSPGSPSARTRVRLGLVLDPLTAAMLVMITFVALWIFVFSIGYMAEDANFTRFFAYLSFFSAAMLGVVIANSLLLLFVCWELVGLASYLLIGFWIHKPSAAAAAKKAFITTRIGDIGFFLGILWLYGSSGTLLFYDDGRGALEAASLLAIGASATFIALLIFCGAVGKSGQFPLHVWLAGCDGRSDAGQRVDPRRDDGGGGRVSGRARLSDLLVRRGRWRHAVAHGRRLDRRHHRADGVADRGRAGRHQTHPRLLHRLAARLDDGVVRRRRRRGRHHSPARAWRSSRRCCSSAPARSFTARITSRTSAAWAACVGIMPVTFATYAIGMMALERRAALLLRRVDERRDPARDGALAGSHVPHYLLMARRGADRVLHDAADDLRLLRATPEHRRPRMKARA